MVDGFSVAELRSAAGWLESVPVLSLPTEFPVPNLRRQVLTSELPAGPLVATGLADLERGAESVAALLVSIGAPRLSSLGLVVPQTIADPERRLYELLAREDPDSAHSRYNAYVRRLVSFERARLPALADAVRIRLFMEALGAEAREDARAYLTGGATAVLLGWRQSTIEVDIKLVPEHDALLRAIPDLKERLQVNVELASPIDFIPVPSGWEDRSPFIGRHGRLSFHHFDFYGQALAKLERKHAQDLVDVREMFDRGLIEASRTLAYFARIEPELYRYPAVDPPTFRQAVEGMLAERG